MIGEVGELRRISCHENQWTRIFQGEGGDHTGECCCQVEKTEMALVFTNVHALLGKADFVEL